MIELDLMTAEQHNQMPEDEDITAADRLIVESPTLTGLIAIRALAPEPGLMPMAQSAIAAAQCSAAKKPKAAEVVSAPSARLGSRTQVGAGVCGNARFCACKLIERALDLDRLRRRRHDDQALERETIGRHALRQLCRAPATRSTHSRGCAARRCCARGGDSSET